MGNANQARQASPRHRSGRNCSRYRGRSRSRGRSRGHTRYRSVSRARPGRDPQSDPDPIPGPARVPEHSQHVDLSPPPRMGDSSRPLFEHSMPGYNSGTTLAPRNDPPLEHARDAEVIRLCKENEDLENMIKRPVSEMAEVRKLVSNASGNGAAVRTTETSVPAPTASKVTASVRILTDSVRQIQVALRDPNRGLRALADRIDAIEAPIPAPATLVQPLSFPAVPGEEDFAFSLKEAVFQGSGEQNFGNISVRRFSPEIQSRSGRPGEGEIYTFIDKKLTHLTPKLKLASGRIEYVMIDILLDAMQRNQRRNSVFILNIYSNPRDSRTGHSLWQDANKMNLTLVTDKTFPKRIGKSVSRDMTPDLAFVQNVEDVAGRTPP
ncbi:hypothetical protein HPB50_009628 [Hyalomma asiaticum]|uniref:Uncharacterized protein n=1 Tax=Hyalomma asiaticum TaxID=266040 RepID=A0ACB7TI36_HYAAI|nr:hypothetical protein HPB50_009628 [Hyalomma asiaticum]